MGRLTQLTDINETHTIEARWENIKKHYYENIRRNHRKIKEI
jgi:hypothetical protein